MSPYGSFVGMRAVLVGCAIVVGCGGGGGGAPRPVDGGSEIDSPPETNPDGTTTITVTLNNLPTDTGAFSFIAAYQDGNGAWKPAPSPSGDKYTFDVASTTWGFAYSCQANVRVAGVATALSDVVEVHFAVAERASLTQDILARCTDRITYVELSGTINPRPSAGTFRIAYNGSVVFMDRTTGTYDMLVAPGTADLLFLHGTDNKTPGDFQVDGAVVQRNVKVTAATTQNLSASNPPATQGPLATITVSKTSTPPPTTTTDLFTASGTAAAVSDLTKGALNSPLLGAAQQLPTDVYDQRVTVQYVANQPVTLTFAAAKPSNQTVPAAPLPLGTTTTTSAATMPYPMFKSTWPAYTGAIGYTWSLAQSPPVAACGGAACTITWTASLSPGAAGAMPSYTMPDLSQLPGWSAALSFVAGTMATGDVTAMTSTAGATDFPSSPPAAGTKRVFAHSKFTVTPP